MAPAAVTLLQQKILAAVGNQAIDETVLTVAGPWMHHQSGRLVEHQQIGILVDNRQGHRPGEESFAGRWCLPLDQDSFAAHDSRRGLGDDDAIEADRPLLDQAFGAAAGDLPQQSRQPAVESLTRQFRCKSPAQRRRR